MVKAIFGRALSAFQALRGVFTLSQRAADLEARITRVEVFLSRDPESDRRAHYDTIRYDGLYWGLWPKGEPLPDNAVIANLSSEIAS